MWWINLIQMTGSRVNQVLHSSHSFGACSSQYHLKQSVLYAIWLGLILLKCGTVLGSKWWKWPFNKEAICVQFCLIWTWIGPAKDGTSKILERYPESGKTIPQWAPTVPSWGYFFNSNSTIKVTFAYYIYNKANLTCLCDQKKVMRSTGPGWPGGR